MGRKCNSTRIYHKFKSTTGLASHCDKSTDKHGSIGKYEKSQDRAGWQWCGERNSDQVNHCMFEGISAGLLNLGVVRVLDGLPRVRAVRKAYTIVEARMAYRMIV
jgi:hypothetical protein